MTRGLAYSKHQPHVFIVNVNAFSVSIRILFVVVVAALVVAELISVPTWPPAHLLSVADCEVVRLCSGGHSDSDCILAI